MTEGGLSTTGGAERGCCGNPETKRRRPELRENLELPVLLPTCVYAHTYNAHIYLYIDVHVVFIYIYIHLC